MLSIAASLGLFVSANRVQASRALCRWRATAPRPTKVVRAPTRIRARRRVPATRHCRRRHRRHRRRGRRQLVAVVAAVVAVVVAVFRVFNAAATAVLPAEGQSSDNPDCSYFGLLHVIVSYCALLRVIARY